MNKQIKIKILEELRRQIDNADDEIIHALAKRFAVVKEVGKLKKEKNIPPLDEKRWSEILNTITTKAKKLNLPEKLVLKLYEEIHQEALTLEK